MARSTVWLRKQNHEFNLVLPMDKFSAAYFKRCRRYCICKLLTVLLLIISKRAKEKPTPLPSPVPFLDKLWRDFPTFFLAHCHKECIVLVFPNEKLYFNYGDRAVFFVKLAEKIVLGLGILEGFAMLLKNILPASPRCEYLTFVIFYYLLLHETNISTRRSKFHNKKKKCLGSCALFSLHVTINVIPKTPERDCLTRWIWLLITCTVSSRPK